MTWKKLALCVAAAAWMVAGAAEDVRHKPFVLASKGAGELEQAAAETKAKLTAAGFTVAGSYAPYPGAVILAVT